MSQQIVVRGESRIGEERAPPISRRGAGEQEEEQSSLEEERAPQISRRPFSPSKHSDGEGRDGVGDKSDKNERAVKRRYDYDGEKSDWAKNGPLGLAYELARFALET